MARPIAPRFEITSLKNKNATDAAQVPASATIDFYRSGATVSAEVAVEPNQPTTVSVYDTGALAAGDTVRVGTTAATLPVNSVSPPTEVVVISNLGTSITLTVGTRLVPTNNRPYVYSDPLGQVIIGDAITTDATTGRGSAYVSRDRLDYDVRIPGEAARLYVDGSGVHGRSDQGVLDLRDYGGHLAGAIAGLPADGGVVFVPAGVWPLSAGVVIQKPNVAIVGEGASSVLQAQGANQFDMITVERQGFRAEDLVLNGAATTADPTGKCCVVVRGVGLSGQSVSGMSMRNVIMQSAPRYGLWLRDATEFYAKNVYCLYNKGSGARIEAGSGGATTTRFIGGGFIENLGRGCEVEGVTSLLFHGVAFEGNQAGAGVTEGNGLEAEDCNRIELRSCYFEYAHTSARAHQFVCLRRCPGALVDGCWFQGGTAASLEPYRPRQAVLFSDSKWARLSSCSAEAMKDYAARFDADSLDCVEFGNADFAAGAGIVRLKVEAQRFVGMSRRAISVPEHATEATHPSAASLPSGSLVWISDPETGNSQLQVVDDNNWANVPLS